MAKILPSLMPISALTIPSDQRSARWLSPDPHTPGRAFVPAHTVADHFSAAEFDLFAVGGEVFSTSIHRSVSAVRTLSPVVGPNMSAYARREMLLIICLQRAHHFTAKTHHPLCASDTHQFDFALLPRFKTYRCTCGNVQTEARVAALSKRSAGFTS